MGHRGLTAELRRSGEIYRKHGLKGSTGKDASIPQRVGCIESAAAMISITGAAIAPDDRKAPGKTKQKIAVNVALTATATAGECLN
ncbi:hypothetical protein C7293_25240 [filamentous cyanobacterium CCT1]|nr:hypothetical protein C7293_25240 [filamentous cyanobacterium CCT1]PSN78471.1 hypothetical protein C8B47_16715 [filamentous cyanobacterium CCP4]